MFGDESAGFTWGGIDFGSFTFDLSATMRQAAEERAAALRAILPPLRVTPAAAVPDTPIGRAYLQLPELARFIVANYAKATASDQYTDAAGVNYKTEAIEFLTRVFNRLACNYSFEEFAADQRGIITRILNVPLFVWDSNIQPIRFDYSPFGMVPFPMQASGSAFFVPPSIGGYWLLRKHYQASQLMVLDFDLQDFAGYGVTWNFDTARGFTFVDGMTASIWYSGGGNAPPNDWPKLFRDYWYRIESERAKFNDKAWLADTMQWIAGALALTGIVGAVNAIVANGVTMTTGLKLAVSVDRFPGVDLGDASKVLSALSRITSVQGLVSNLAGSLTDSGASATSDALLSTGEPMDDFSFGDFGADAGFGDIPFGDAAGFGGSVDFGDGFGYAWGGDWGTDFASDVAGETFDALALPDSFDSALDSLTTQSGSIFGDLNIGALLTQLASTYVQYDIAKRQIEARGGSVPPTVRPTPGQVRTMPDGTTIRTNNDGTTTVRTPDGATRTVTQGGQIITQTPAPAGGSIVPGMSNQTLLIGGAVAVGALLLLSRRKG